MTTGGKHPYTGGRQEPEVGPASPPVTRCVTCGLDNHDQVRTPFLDLSVPCGRNDSRPCGRLVTSETP